MKMHMVSRWSVMVMLGWLCSLVVMVTAGAPRLAAAEPESKVHRLGPDDLLEIKVFRQPDLETRVRLTEDGVVMLPLLGSVVLSGKTVAQARVLIRDLLAKDYLANPQVTVSVIEYGKCSFTVLGEVQRPGSYEIPPDQSYHLLQAIAVAGGYTRLGAPGRVTVQRVQDGKKQAYRLDAGAMATDPQVALFAIRPGDTVIVGEKVF
ncbi:MAG: polysaccharide biosynthesis/export family protein [Verrucomicrobiota bacterium]